MANRLVPLTEKLRERQLGSVRQIAGKVNLGMIAVATILMVWPDHSLCTKLILGFPQMGWMERTGVLRPRKPKEPMDLDEFSASAQVVIQKIKNGTVRPEEQRFCRSVRRASRRDSVASCSQRRR